MSDENPITVPKVPDCDHTLCDQTAERVVWLADGSERVYCTGHADGLEDYAIAPRDRGEVLPGVPLERASQQTLADVRNELTVVDDETDT